jgi:hypothetical protein
VKESNFSYSEKRWIVKENRSPYVVTDDLAALVFKFFMRHSLC